MAGEQRGVRSDVTLAGTTVAPGERRQVDIQIAELSSGFPVRMPVHVINGHQPGPQLFISAALHGDEINGVEIIRRFTRLTALRDLCGSVVAVPIVNTPGFLYQSRYLPDRRDLNRSFPGSHDGSLAGRIARCFLDEIVSGSSWGVDLHTGSHHRSNYPQVRASLDSPEIEAAARAFGVPVVLNAGFRQGSLREAANSLGVPVIVYEAGEALRFDEAGIRAGVRGIIGVMQHLAMLPRRDEHSELPEPLVLRSSRWVRAPCSGVLRVIEPLGAQVRRDQVLAFISDPWGMTDTEIEAPVDGVIVGRTNMPVVHDGDALFNIALAEGTQIDARALDDFSPLEQYETGATADLARAERQIV